MECEGCGKEIPDHEWKKRCFSCWKIWKNEENIDGDEMDVYYFASGHSGVGPFGD